MKVIKKYRNRKFYFPEEHRHTTLSELLKMSKDHIEFTVIDKDTQQDITHNTLLRAQLEEAIYG